MTRPEALQAVMTGPPSAFAERLARGREALRKGERTRADLLRAGARLLSGGALDRLTVADVCKEAGVAHGTFYIYFPNLSALAAEVLGAFVDHVQLEMRDAARLPGDAARNTTEAYMRLFEANAGLMKCLVTGVDAFPEARAAFQRLNREWVETVTRAALRQGGAGARPEAETMRRAYALGGMVDQYLTALHVTGDPSVAALSGDREAVLDTLTDLWKRGMSP
jgi:TetR/AcrR family transcriptional regulator, ethionamide resistance regulator